MEATQANRDQLRQMIDEIIPAGGSEANTRFLNSELDQILAAAATIEAAAAEGWIRKAARAYSNNGGLIETQAGDEKFKFADPKDFRAHSLEMAAYYRSLIPGSGLSVFAYAELDVLGEPEEEEIDVTRYSPES